MDPVETAQGRVSKNFDMLMTICLNASVRINPFCDFRNDDEVFLWRFVGLTSNWGLLQSGCLAPSIWHVAVGFRVLLVNRNLLCPRIGEMTLDAVFPGRGAAHTVPFIAEKMRLF